MKVLGAVALSLALLTSSTFAATTVSLQPLPAGHAAGTKQAALLAGTGFFILIGIAAIAGGLAFSASSNGNNGITSSTTSSTSTLP